MHYWVMWWLTLACGLGASAQQWTGDSIIAEQWAPAPAPAPSRPPAPLSVTPPPGCASPATLAARASHTVYTRPDLATIDLTITATAPSAARARELAANTSQAILSAVESVDRVGRGGMASAPAGAFLARAMERGEGAVGGGGAPAPGGPPPPPPAAASLFRFRTAFVISVRDPAGGHSEGGGFEGAVSRALDAAVRAAGGGGGGAGNGSAVLALSGVRAGLSPRHAEEAEAAARAGAVTGLRAAAARDAAALGLRLGGLAAFGGPPPPVVMPGVPSAAANVDDALGSGAAATPAAATAGLPPPAASPTPVVLGNVPTAAAVEGTFWVCGVEEVVSGGG